VHKLRDEIESLAGNLANALGHVARVGHEMLVMWPKVDSDFIPVEGHRKATQHWRHLGILQLEFG
jgi:hypothetical protein